MLRIGLDLGGSKIEGIVLDDDGQVLARWRIAAPQDDYELTIGALQQLVAGLDAEVGRPATHIGVGIPGAISPHSGLVKNANSTWLIGRPFDRDLESALARPVRVANDANCFAASEANDGAAADARIVFGVILGTGVGAGIIIDRRPLVGRNAIAGEWGHNPLPWPVDDERPGRRCYCGRTGCIETYLSGPGLTADHATVNGASLQPDEIVGLARANDAAAKATMSRYEDRLARGLAGVINVLDPDVIVLGGGLSKIERLYDVVPKLWDRYVFSDEVTTDLRPPAHGDASGVRGAAWLWPSKGQET